MCFHEVPNYLNPLNVPIMKRIVMSVFTMTVHHLLPLITATPLTTAPPMHSIHVCGVWQGEPVTVHGGHDVVQVVHLVMIIPATRGDYGPIRPWSKVVWSIQRIRNSAVIQTMDVNDVERADWHGVESS